MKNIWESIKSLLVVFSYENDEQLRIFRKSLDKMLNDSNVDRLVIVVNILKETQKYCNSNIYALIGGFHLYNKFDRVVKNIVMELNKFSISVIAPCHCTGEKAKHYLQQECFNSHYSKMNTGSILEFTY